MDAVLPLIGVVIGAVLGGGVAFLLDRRREQRAARAALRLVVEELRRTRLSWGRVAGEWKEAPTAETADRLIAELQGKRWATAQWKNHQEVLAASLSRENWEAVADAYQLIGLIDAALDEAADTAADSESSAELLALVTDNLKYLDQAIERLQREAGS
jgi:hypothetical protein